MDANTVVQVISTVGFPIAMCLLVYYQNEKTLETLKETINNNTMVLKELVLKLDTISEKGDKHE